VVTQLQRGTFYVIAPDGDPCLASTNEQRMQIRAEQLNDALALAVKLERRRVRAKAKKARGK
jgi:hypothetical protein